MQDVGDSSKESRVSVDLISNATFGFGVSRLVVKMLTIMSKIIKIRKSVNGFGGLQINLIDHNKLLDIEKQKNR